VFDYCKVINLKHTDEQAEDNKELVQEPEPVIRSQTVVLRRSSDGKKQENADDDKTQAQQQERQDQPIVRSRTVLLKQSAEIDQQGDKQEEKDSSLDPPESSTRADREDVYSKEHQRIPGPPDSPRSQPKSPRSQRRVTSSEENNSTEQIAMQDK